MLCTPVICPPKTTRTLVRAAGAAVILSPKTTRTLVRAAVPDRPILPHSFNAFASTPSPGFCPLTELAVVNQFAFRDLGHIERGGTSLTFVVTLPINLKTFSLLALWCDPDSTGP